MIYLLTLISALSAIIGNVTAKYWADNDSPIWLIATFVVYTISTFAYAESLHFGKFTIINALFYAIVPIITTIFGVLLFKDRITLLQSVGIILSVIGIVLFTIEGKVSHL